MNILLIGTGGREQALAWKISQSPQLKKLYITSEINSDYLISFAKENNIDLVIIGPEKPLAMGVSDALNNVGIATFGPSQLAAEIETSKAFSKQFMQRHNIPTARFAIFTDITAANEYIDQIDYSVVIKVSGLAAGKGVFLPETNAEAKEILQKILVEKILGDAGDEVVIEERLTGPEVSLLAFSDGITVRAMPAVRDHKRLLDGNQGPNTGGMGTYSPVPNCNEDFTNKIVETILQPTIDGLRAEDRTFVGVLYTGLMLTPTGPKVLEFNARFGDPETQVLMRLLDSDLLEICKACTEQRLAEINIMWKKSAAVCVVLAAENYPDNPRQGDVITGLNNLPNDIVVFPAGVRYSDNTAYTAGGRVLGVTAEAVNIKTAVQKVYSAINHIHFDGMQYRKDIGKIYD